MKSDKTVKELEEICLPFIFRPTTVIQGGVNGQMFNFYPGGEYEITLPIYEAIYNGNYGKQLEN